jgi:serine/threonine-protein kinase
MTLRPLACAALLGLSLFSATGPLAAAEPKEDAREFLRHGVDLRREHRNEEALEEFQRAYALEPTPVALAQIALAEQSLRRWVEAERDLVKALGTVGDTWIDENRPLLEEQRAKIDANLGWLNVSVNVPGAAASLDGRSIPSEEAVRVPVGVVVLKVQAEGFETEMRRVDVARGPDPTRVSVVLVAEPPRAFERQPVPTPILPSPKEERPAPRPSLVPPLAVGAVGVIGLGVGSYFGFRALDDKNSRATYCKGLSCTNQRGLDYDSDARTSATASTIAFATGAACVAASAVWLLLVRSPAPQSHAVVAPVVSPGFAGLAIKGAL